MKNLMNFPIQKNNRKSIPARVKAQLITSNQCANHPENFAMGCKNYLCPMWLINGGFFDESGYQIDHIVEVSHGGGNNIENLQVLCPSCHSVKTKRAAAQKWEYDSIDIDNGMAKMEIN